MNPTFRSGFVAVLALSGALSYADYSFAVRNDHLSGFQDTSNLAYSESVFQIDFDHTGSDTLYIDNLEFLGDTGDLTLASGPLSYQVDGSGEDLTYNYGDAITGDFMWRFKSIASHVGSSLASIAMHDFTMNIWGRIDDGTQSILATLYATYDVRGKLDVTVTGELSKPIIQPGGTTALSVTVKNNMASDFKTITWFISSMRNGTGSELQGAFDYSFGWSGRNIAPGESLTGGHSLWTAKLSNPDGVYTGNLGVVGGLYDGDWHMPFIDPATKITVRSVPGPTPLLYMAAGLAGVFARKRRK